MDVEQRRARKDDVQVLERQQQPRDGDANALRALVSSDPDWYFSLVPGQFTDARVPGASHDALRATLFHNPGEHEDDALSVFAAYLFSNNAQVSILAFALGFAFGIPSLLLLVQNTGTLGAMLWLYHGQGLTLDFVGWLSVHGTTELFAILLAMSLLLIGVALAETARVPVAALIEPVPLGQNEDRAVVPERDRVPSTR